MHDRVQYQRNEMVLSVSCTSVMTAVHLCTTIHAIGGRDSELMRLTCVGGCVCANIASPLLSSDSWADRTLDANNCTFMHACVCDGYVQVHMFV